MFFSSPLSLRCDDEAVTVTHPGSRAEPDCLTAKARAVLPSSGVKLCIFVGINVGGYIGWELGERFGLMTAFLISSVGSIVGVYAGWKLARHLME